MNGEGYTCMSEGLLIMFLLGALVILGIIMFFQGKNAMSMVKAYRHEVSKSKAWKIKRRKQGKASGEPAKQFFRREYGAIIEDVVEGGSKEQAGGYDYSVDYHTIIGDDRRHVVRISSGEVVGHICAEFVNGENKYSATAYLLSEFGLEDNVTPIHYDTPRALMENLIAVRAVENVFKGISNE